MRCSSGLFGELSICHTSLDAELDQSTSQIIGEIPESFGELPFTERYLKNLTLLFLYDNQFTVMIQESIRLFPWLSSIRLFANKLTGELPPELGKHSSLGKIWKYQTTIFLAHCRSLSTPTSSSTISLSSTTVLKMGLEWAPTGMDLLECNQSM
jgi:hypothetical protein